MEAEDQSNMMNAQETGHCLIQMSAMGVLVGILVVILGGVLTGWVWTYWTVKKLRKKLKVNSTQVR